MKFVINYFILIVLVLVTNFSVDYYKNTLISNQKEIVLKEAKTHYLSLVNIRHWNEAYGGVYVKPKDGMQPNPYLKDNTLRVNDELTLIKINPAWMTRQLSEQLQNEDFRFKITSLKPKNPHNKADLFETKALQYFEKTPYREYSEFQANQFKYMGALVTGAECLVCHIDQGYQIGDIRGGISITLDAKSFLAQVEHIEWISLVTKFIMIFFGFIISFLIHKQLLNNQRLQKEVELQTKEISEKNIYHRNLLEANLDPFITISIDGKITDLNKATIDAIGLTRILQ